MLALDGLRVVEASDYESVQYCGRLLATLGAQVTRLERVSAESLRMRPPFAFAADGSRVSIAHEFLNAGKRSIVLGAPQARQETLGVLRAADVVITTSEHWDSLGPEAGIDRSRQLLVKVGAFGGMSGHPPTSAFTRFHASGTGYLVPSNDDPARPAWSGPYAFETVHGACLAVSVLSELRRQTGGEVDYSYQAYGIWMEKMFFNRVALRQIPDYHRWTMAYSYGGFMECRDGWVSILLVEDHQWRNICRAMGRDDWTADPRFADGVERVKNREVINDELSAWCGRHSVAELIDFGRTFDFPIGWVRELGGVLGLDVLRQREFFRDVQTNIGPARLPGLPLGRAFAERTPQRAPQCGEGTRTVLAESAVVPAACWKARTTTHRSESADDVRSGPLAGVRVLDLTWAAAGPIATSFMAYLGADVAKVEVRTRPDLMRVAGKQYGFGSADADLDSSPSFQDIAAGKRSIELDLATAEGRETAFRLACAADVVIDNMRPGKVESLGLSYEAVSAVNPGVIMCSQSATGRVSSPPIPGYAPIFWAEGGGASLTGWPDGAPGAVRGPVDFHAAAFALFGILGLLHERDRTGKGGYIDCSAIEAVVAMFGVELLELAAGHSRIRDGNRFPGVLVNDVFPCHGDDEWIAVTVRDVDAWRTFCDLLGPGDWPDRPAAEDGVLSPPAYEQIENATRRCDAARLEGALQARGVPAVRSLSFAAALGDPRLAERGVWQVIDHDTIGTQTTVGIPWMFDALPYNMPRPAPRLGEHTEQIVKEWLA